MTPPYWVTFIQIFSCDRERPIYGGLRKMEMTVKAQRNGPQVLHYCWF